MKNIVVIGGGTSGWITAIFAKKKFSDSVTIISPSSIDILGAGEGSTPNMVGIFRNFNIDIEDFLIKTDATIKTGIEFSNWNKDVSGSFGHLFNLDGDGIYGFHFNARKTADYLESHANSIGIKKMDSVISDFIKDSNGDVIKIIMEDGSELECDFVFDCSGFQRLLIGKHFKSKWKSYSNTLICNKAFSFFQPQLENLDEKSETKTKAISMSSGWMWQIPLQNRWGCGYVFNDEFISLENAIEEVEKFVGAKIKVEKVFDFNPGVYENTWVNNCVSLGLASGFIEPLEATSIMTLVESLNKLTKFNIFEKNPTNINDYNIFVQSISEQIVNFLLNHYKCDRVDTPFWRHINQIKLTPELEKIKSQGKMDIKEIKKLFNVHRSDNVVFGGKNYEVVNYGHQIKKQKKSLI
jgi:tryptophan halogenase